MLMPAWMRRLIVVEGFLRPPDQVARKVEEQGANALRPAIDGQQQGVPLIHVMILQVPRRFPGCIDSQLQLAAKGVLYQRQASVT